MYATLPPLDEIQIPVCGCCPRELHDADYGRLACWKCESRMYDQLNAVAKLWSQLPDSAHRLVAARENGRSMSVHPGMPGNANVINLTGPGSDTPFGWLLAVEDDWRRVRGLPMREHYGRPVEALPLLLRFLQRHLQWACAAHKNPRIQSGEPLLPDVQALNEALGRIVGDLTSVVTGEPRARTIPVRCFAEYQDGSECGAEIRVGANTLRTVCPGCGAEWLRETFLRIAQQANQFGAAA